MNADRILIVEDEKLLRWALKERLSREGFEILEAESGEAARPLFATESIDLVLLDYRLPDTTGIELLKEALSLLPGAPIILMTAYSTVETAVEAIRLGAFDYINKPFDQDELVITIRKALETSRLRREVSALRRQQDDRFKLPSLIGESPAMQEIYRLISKVARSAASTVLITGESGTGKDMIARAIHGASDRAGGAFMNITCSALPESLLESELMGHERGAFTDARATKQGLFELAHGGSVFLDEIGDMGVILQAKLLRFLEEKTFRRVGGLRDIRVDVRVIAATNRDLGRAVDEGRFREDLYYRLKVIPIHIPPLRERREDIPLLVKHFIDHFNRDFRKKCQGVTADAMDLLRAHEWRGNVRELRNIIERAMILEDKERLDLTDLPEEITRGGAGVAGVTHPASLAVSGGFTLPAEGYSLDRMEMEMVRQALQNVGGNQTRAARLLSISRDALRYKMKKYAL